MRSRLTAILAWTNGTVVFLIVADKGTPQAALPADKKDQK
jgi:hypothetical protein